MKSFSLRLAVIYVFRTIVHIKLFFTFVFLSSKIIANDYVISSSLYFFFVFRY